MWGNGMNLKSAKIKCLIKTGRSTTFLQFIQEWTIKKPIYYQPIKDFLHSIIDIVVWYETTYKREGFIKCYSKEEERKGGW